MDLQQPSDKAFYVATLSRRSLLWDVSDREIERETDVIWSRCVIYRSRLLFASYPDVINEKAWLCSFSAFLLQSCWMQCLHKPLSHSPAWQRAPAGCSIVQRKDLRIAHIGAACVLAPLSLAFMAKGIAIIELGI